MGLKSIFKKKKPGANNISKETEIAIGNAVHNALLEKPTKKTRAKKPEILICAGRILKSLNKKNSEQSQKLSQAIELAIKYYKLRKKDKHGTVELEHRLLNATLFLENKRKQ